MSSLAVPIASRQRSVVPTFGFPRTVDFQHAQHIAGIPAGFAPVRATHTASSLGGRVAANVDIGAAWRAFSTTPSLPTASGQPTFRPFERPTTAPRDLDGLRDEALLRALRDQAADHVRLTYKGARQALFGVLDNDRGVVREVYTGREVATKGIPDARGVASLNTEHTWPRSEGLERTGGVSDLHHLFPTDTDANNERGTLPFGEVVDVRWERGGSKLGLDAEGRTVFEPPEEHKGNVARALFYIAASYDLDIDDAEEAVLRTWHALDPVDGRERSRNAAIADLQGNTNAFIDDPRLVGRIRNF